MDGPLLAPGRLASRLGDPGVAVVDCRFTLGAPGAGEQGYLAGHIPGASFLDLDRDLAGPPGRDGRHPLPEPTAFEAAARRAGIGERTLVVAYDEAGEGGAARLWWLLRHLGHERAVVLDGGLRAWRESGGQLATGSESPEPGDFRARLPREDDTADADELLARLGDPSLTLLDARAPERFRGEQEPLDPIAGHIPGARNLPYTEVAGDFPTLEGDVVAYCGSGVTACVLVLAGEAAGVPVRLYPGSWSEWSRRGLPAEPRR